MTGDERDSKGRYTKKILTTEQALAMQARRWDKGREDTAASLLSEAGYNDENPPPEHLKVLAEIAASKKASAVAALRDLVKLTGKQESTSQPGKPAPGTICPLCNELVFTDFRPSKKQLDQAAEYLGPERNTIV